MKINFDTSHGAFDPHFGDLTPGDCFLYEECDTVFMKIEQIRDEDNYKLNAIDLSAATLAFIPDEEIVKPISVVLNKVEG
jgi:hypothetical protein